MTMHGDVAVGLGTVTEVIRCLDGREWHCVDDDLAILIAGYSQVGEVNHLASGEWSVWSKGTLFSPWEKFKTRDEAMRLVEVRSNLALLKKVAGGAASDHCTVGDWS